MTYAIVCVPNVVRIFNGFHPLCFTSTVIRRQKRFLKFGPKNPHGAILWWKLHPRKSAALTWYWSVTHRRPRTAPPVASRLRAVHSYAVLSRVKWVDQICWHFSQFVRLKFLTDKCNLTSHRKQKTLLWLTQFENSWQPGLKFVKIHELKKLTFVKIPCTRSCVGFFFVDVVMR